MAKQNQGMSLNPEDFTEGGGLVDDVNVTWKDVGFEMFDYQGKSPNPVPALKVEMEDEEGETYEQFWSMGNAQDWSPSTDGKQLISVGSATGIRASSNGGILLKSLVDSGFPKGDIGEDITVFEGLQCHMIRVPAPKRPGLKKSKDEEEKGFAATILIVDEIITMPGEKKKPAGAPGKAKTKAKTGKAKEKATEDTGDLTEKAQEVVLGIVLEKGEVGKKKLPTLVFGALKKDPDKGAIAKLVFDDDFLASGEWEYDEETEMLSMG